MARSEWLERLTREEALLFLAFWENLHPLDRKLAAYRVLLSLAPCYLVGFEKPGYVPFRHGTGSANERAEREIKGLSDCIDERWLETVKRAARLGRLPDSATQRSPIIEFGFMALLRDIVFQDGGEAKFYERSQEENMPVVELALDLERLRPAVHRWLHRNKPTDWAGKLILWISRIWSA